METPFPSPGVFTLESDKSSSEVMYINKNVQQTPAHISLTLPPPIIQSHCAYVLWILFFYLTVQGSFELISVHTKLPRFLTTMCRCTIITKYLPLLGIWAVIIFPGMNFLILKYLHILVAIFMAWSPNRWYSWGNVCASGFWRLLQSCLHGGWAGSLSKLWMGMFLPYFHTQTSSILYIANF